MKTLTTQAELQDAKHEAGLHFLCAECGAEKPVQTSGGTGYGYNDNKQPICYACCAIGDTKRMADNGRIALYLTHNKAGLNPFYEVTNWPGTLRLPVRHMRKGRHNMARVRYDVYFTGPDKKQWHGTQYGDNTQVCHCKRINS